MGLIHPNWRLTPRDPSQPAWQEAEHKGWQAARMETYAAQIERMDRGIGRILEALEETGQWERTLILFLADNGGCAEEIGADWMGWLTAQNAHAETRDGRKVQFRQRPRDQARRRRHLPELRGALGERQQHPVSRVQALGP